MTWIYEMLWQSSRQTANSGLTESVQHTVQKIVLRLQWKRVVRVRDAVCFIFMTLETSAINLTHNT